MSGTSPTLVLVLEKLGRTDGRSLLKLAVKELIARGVLRVESEEKRFGLRRGPRFWLLEGSAGPPSSRALQVTHRHVLDVRSVVRDGRPARELKAVAKALAGGGARREVLAGALQDLIAMGLVREEERRTLGLFRRTVAVRTPGGDALVERERRRRAGDGSTGGADAPYYPIVVDPGYPDHDPDRTDGALDGSLDSGFDSGFDGAFDSSFDSSFDSAFDSSFDSGFSDGGGGGGDGGGGGGDGGGGGGGGD